MASTTATIRSLITLNQAGQLQDQVKQYLNTEFNDLDTLLDRPDNAKGGPSRKKRKTLDQEIGYWESIESNAAKEVPHSLWSTE